MRRRLHQRGAAAKMTMPYVLRAAGLPMQLPKSVKNLSINAMASAVTFDIRESEPGNVKSRVWAPSKPVIHIATAVALVAETLRMHGAIQRDAEVYQYPEHLSFVVEVSEMLAAILPTIGNFRIDPRRLIRLTIA